MKTINAICEDKQGFIWFGTYDGVYKYDGYKFKEYRQRPFETKTLADNLIESIFCDSRGILWIGTQNGLNSFDPVTKAYATYLNSPKDSNSLASNRVVMIFEDSKGILWFGSDSRGRQTEGGLNSFNPLKNLWTRYVHNPGDKNSISDNSVFGMAEDESGLIWIATYAGLNSFDRVSGKFTRYLKNNRNVNGLQNDFLHDIKIDSSGTIWLASFGGGIVRFTPSEKQFVHYKVFDRKTYAHADNSIRKVIIDNKGQIWVGMYRKGLGLFRKETENFTLFQFDPFENSSLGGNFIHSMYIDRRENLWIGLEGKGVNRVKQNSGSIRRMETDYSKMPNSIPDDNITDIYQDKFGYLWVATFSSGLVQINQRTNTVERFNKVPDDNFSLSSDNIYSVVQNADGKLWVATGEGISIFDYKKKIFKRIQKSVKDNPYHLSNNFVTVLHIDRSGTMWVGTSAGVDELRLGSKVFINYQHDPFDSTTISPGRVHDIHEDRKGRLWIATEGGGLNVFDKTNGNFRHYLYNPNSLNSISSNMVIRVLEDKKETIWIATENGLNRFEVSTENFKHYFKEQGLADDFLSDMCLDSSGVLWVATPKGISRFDDTTDRFRSFGAESELTSINCWSIVYNNSTGELIIGPRGGLNFFKPNSLIEDTVVAPIYFTGFSVFDKPFETETSISFLEEIYLSYQENFFTIEFASLDFVPPQYKQYSYYLEGFDKKWSLASEKNYASYTNVPPGDYVFKVKGSNSDGIWGKEEKHFKIFITPPWWKTAWAYTGFAFVFILLIYSFRRFEKNRERLKHQAELEHLEAEKLREVDQLKSNFFANISHEFRTPLTLIEGPAKQLSSDQYPAEVKENAGMIARNTKRLLRLVNQLLDLSRIESGQMKLHFQKLDIVYLLKSVAASFESFAASKEISFVFDLPSNPIIGYFDKDAMQKIITNLLSNAFKYTKAKGTVTIKLTNYSVSREESINNTEYSSADKILKNKKGINDFLFIKITDTGIGIEEEELPHIFDRFYQVDASQTREQEGTGIGLSLTKELVELHGGEISVKSEVGKGSSFIVKLPLSREHFKPEDVVEMEEAENVKQEIIYEAPQIETKKIIIPEKDSEKSFDEKLPLMLIIEDNIDMRKYMRSNMDDMFRIIEAVNGEEGVQKAIQNIPDIIISDVMMPKVDGFQVCEILKLDERTSHIPIILLTAKADRRIEGLETGADDYITKPFDAQELKVRVKNLIEQRKKLREKFRKEGMFILKDDNITSADEKFLNRVMELAEKNISDRSFTTDKLASELFMSRMQLHRKMRGFIGHSPGEFIRKIRMEKAKQLLSHRAGTIAEIAYQVGYEDPSRFSNAFRAQFGILPSDFLKEQSHNLS